MFLLAVYEHTTASISALPVGRFALRGQPDYRPSYTGKRYMQWRGER